MNASNVHVTIEPFCVVLFLYLSYLVLLACGNVASHMYLQSSFSLASLAYIYPRDMLYSRDSSEIL